MTPNPTPPPPPKRPRPSDSVQNSKVQHCNFNFLYYNQQFENSRPNVSEDKMQSVFFTTLFSQGSVQVRGWVHVFILAGLLVLVSSN